MTKGNEMTVNLEDLEKFDKYLEKKKIKTKKQTSNDKFCFCNAGLCDGY